jgi:hypothetical protein
MGMAKGEAGIQRAPTQAKLRNQAVTRDDVLTRSFKDLPLVFLNPTVVAAPGQSHSCNRPPANSIRGNGY